MIKLTFKTVVAFFIIIISSPSFGDITDGCAVPISDENVTRVYFANGMGNSFEDAISSTLLLEDAYINGLLLAAKNDEKFDFASAYNESRGKIVDFLEVFQQKMEEEGISGNSFLLYQMTIDEYPLDEVQFYFPTLTEQTFGELLELVSFIWGSALRVQTNTQLAETRHVNFSALV